jgi:DNA-directed RNA polymerase subunit beta'
MAVHVPLSTQARQEASELMLSSHNLLKPADGQPATSATQDIVLGLNYVTKPVAGARGDKKAFASTAEAVMAYQLGELAVNAAIRAPRPDKPSELVETTLGRLLFF